MTLVREQGSEIIAQFNVPIRGTWKNIAAQTVPVDALHDSLNVFIREGKLRNRPGLTLNDDTAFAEPILGGGMVVTPTERVILAITRNRVYQLSDVSNIWTSVSPIDSTDEIADNDNSVIDMAFMETAGDYVALIASEGKILKRWVNSPRGVATLTGTNIPAAKSVCIASSRVVVLVPPHTVRWSGILNPSSFSSLAYAKRAQSGDVGICVRSLSALSFVLYKERSIHIARAQAGLDEGTSFSFSEPLYVEGPAGIYAIVNVNGMHYYMTKNGRIAVFDGTNVIKWIADGLWLFLQKDINQTFAHRIRGVYDYRLHTLTFFYPKVGTEGILRGMVLINLPYEGQDIAEPAVTKAFLGFCEKSIVHACEARSRNIIDRSFLFSSPLNTQDTSQAYIFDEESNVDEDIPFTCSIQTGLQAMPDARHTQVVIETFMERAEGYGVVKIEPVTSDALETPSGTIPDVEEQYIDLEQNPIAEYKGFNKILRFFGIRYTWLSTNTVRYSGAVVYNTSISRFKR